MERPAGEDGRATAPRVPDGRVLIVSMSGTDRTGWALGAVALAVSLFGAGAAVGRWLERAERERRGNAQR